MTPFKKTFLVLYAAIFMSSVGVGILAPILPVYVDQFSASGLVLGIIFGSYSAARTLFMPPVGSLSDRFGRRAFIVGGLLLFTAVSPLYAVASTSYELILVRFIHGVAGAMIMPVALSAIGDLAPVGKEGFIMGSFTSAFFAGLGFGPLIGGYMRDQYSMAAAFFAMGALSLAALVFTLLALPPFPPGGIRHRNGDPGGKGKLEKSVLVLVDLPLMGLLFYRFTRAIGIGLVWVIMPLFAAKSLGISALDIGILLSVNTFITTLIQSPAGHLSDRIGHRKSLAAGTLLSCTALAFLALAGNFKELMLSSVLLGLAGALIVPAGSALAVSLGRTRGMGRTMGLYSSSLSLGTMLGPVFGGAVLDLAGARTVFLSGAILGMLGWGGLVLTFPKKMEN